MDCTKPYFSEWIGGSQVAPGECCWGQETIAHGDTAITIPHCCTTIVCNKGLLEKHNLRAVNCCEFGGELYQTGAQLEGHCAILVCSRGTWVIKQDIDDCCARCSAYDDPHFTTFDEHHYDFHGTCNYSLAQIGTSWDTHTAVYSQFQSCYDHASCLNITVFREDPHTLITLSQGVSEQVSQILSCL